MAGKQADIKVGVVTNYDDKGIKQAETGLAGFKKSIGDAEGAGGKLKAGFASAKESVIANAGAIAVAAGGALVMFGIKAVGEFTKVAKAALDMGAATGLSVEDSSRWIAVADDMGISADTLQGSLGKVSKTLDETKWAEYGIETRDAGGEARDVNDILLDTFDMLGDIENETERARVGNDLFGRGYANLAPLIGRSRSEMEKYLGAVEKGQVITDQEAAKAEKFRLAQDALKDALNEVTLAVGGVVAEMAPMVENVAAGITKFSEMVGKADELTESIGGLNAVLQLGGPTGAWGAYNATMAATTDFIGFNSIPTLDELETTLADVNITGAEARTIINEWKTAHGEINPEIAETDRETRKLAGTMGDSLTPEVKSARHETDLFAESVANLDEKYRELTGRLDEEDAWANVNESIANFRLNTDGTAQDVRDLTRDIADYVIETETIPESKKTEILALLDEGKIAEAELALAALTRTREIYLTLTGPGATTAAGYSSSPIHAGGGQQGMGHSGIAGEYGRELVTEGANVRNPAETRDIMSRSDGGGNIINITMPVGTNDRDLMRALKKMEARNGPGWRS